VAQTTRNVDLHRLFAAHALNLVLLQHAQQLGLHVGADLTQLVEEDRAAVRELEATELLLTAPVNEPRS